MSYSLFSKEYNFTEVLFGKSDDELVKERDSSDSTCSSGTSSPTSSVDSGHFSNDNDYARNFFLLKVLDFLLEVHDPRFIQHPTHPPPPRIVPVSSSVSNPPSMVHAVPPPATLLPPSLNFAVPHPCIPQHQGVPHLIPVPFVPTHQMMAITPPIGYY